MNTIANITLFLFTLCCVVSFKRPNIIRCPSYPNMNNMYNYTYGFQTLDNVLCDNYKFIINDKKRRNIYLRLRENMVNRNIYMQESRKKDVKKKQIMFFYILYKNNLDDYLFGKLLGVSSTEY